MALKNNFKKAVKELMDGPEASQPTKTEPTPIEPSASEPMPAYSPEPEVPPEYTPPNFTDSIPEEPTSTPTIIAPGTIIRGSVESNCDIEMYGEVHGDIITTKDLKLKGKIRGNATGGNVELSGIQMVGNVVAAGVATMDSNSEVEGDVTANSVILNGKIWGNVQVASRLALESNAIICGHVSAEKLAVDEGAVIQGEIFISKSAVPPKREKPPIDEKKRD